MNVTLDVLNSEPLDRSAFIIESKIGSDTVEILADYEGSRYFSADRHYERSICDQSKAPAINLETLQFNNILLGNLDEITMEARALLSQWMDRAAIDGISEKRSDKISKRLVKDIIHDLDVRPISSKIITKDAFDSLDLRLKSMFVECE